MTGPEHYLEADKWRQASNDGKDRAAAMECLALAQYHATMATAAASALIAISQHEAAIQPTDAEYTAWIDALGLR